MAVDGFEKFFHEHPFFRDVAEEHVTAIAGCTTSVVFEQGDYLFRQGEAAERFFVLRFGRAAVESYVPTRGPITIETVEAGEVLGWSWLFPPYKWHFDARAQTLVRALSVDALRLRARSEHDPVLGLELMRRFSQVVVLRLEATQLQLLDLYGHPKS